MALPTAYLTSTKNLHNIFEAVQKAQAPPRFTQKFLEGLGFPSSSDRLIINLLKAIGLLSETGEPTSNYHRFLDKSQTKTVLAEGIRRAYADLFQVNNNANAMTRDDVKNKMKTLSQGQHSESVLDKMAMTFKALASEADWNTMAYVPAVDAPAGNGSGATVPNQRQESGEPSDSVKSGNPLTFGGLVYNINLHLPESRDPAVYDALFRSLREHLS